MALEVRIAKIAGRSIGEAHGRGSETVWNGEVDSSGNGLGG